jgi:hypothetical protein
MLILAPLDYLYIDNFGSKHSICPSEGKTACMLLVPTHEITLATTTIDL